MHVMSIRPWVNHLPVCLFLIYGTEHLEYAAETLGYLNIHYSGYLNKNSRCFSISAGYGEEKLNGLETGWNDPPGWLEGKILENTLM